MKTSWQMSGVDPTWPFDPLVIRPAEGGILAPVSDATPYGAAVRCADRDICTDVTEYNQVAMFDVEACEWHFVSRDGFAWEL